MKLKLTDLPVVYINLDEQTDRKQTLEENLKGLGFKNIIRVSAVSYTHLTLPTKRSV